MAKRVAPDDVGVATEESLPSKKRKESSKELDTAWAVVFLSFGSSHYDGLLLVDEVKLYNTKQEAEDAVYEHKLSEVEDCYYYDPDDSPVGDNEIGDDGSKYDRDTGRYKHPVSELAKLTREEVENTYAELVGWARGIEIVKCYNLSTNSEHTASSTAAPSSRPVWVLTHISELCDIHCDGDGWSTLETVGVFTTRDAAEEAKYNLLWTYVAERYDDYVDKEKEDMDEDDPPIKELDDLTREEVIEKFHEFNETASEYNPNSNKFEVRECQVDTALVPVPAKIWSVNESKSVKPERSIAKASKSVPELFRTRASAEMRKVELMLDFINDNSNLLRNSDLLKDPRLSRVFDAACMHDDEFCAKYDQSLYVARHSLSVGIIERLYGCVNEKRNFTYQNIDIVECQVFD